MNCPEEPAAVIPHGGVCEEREGYGVGHYGYYGIAGNFRALQKVHRFVERYWRKMLNSRSREGSVTWEVFHKIKERFPLQRPRLKLNYVEFQAFAVL